MTNKSSGASPQSNGVEAILLKALASRQAQPAPAPTPFQGDMSTVSGDASTLARTLAHHDTSHYTTQFVRWAQDLRTAIVQAKSPADIRQVMDALDRIQAMPEVDQLPTHFTHLRTSVIDFIRTDRPDLYQAAHSEGIL